jgi:hypothetical protein
MGIARKIVLGICLLLFSATLCLFLPIYPQGATRAAILCSGYPLEAITTGLELYENSNGEQYYILSNPPYELETDAVLYQWRIERHGIFYWAHFGIF